MGWRTAFGLGQASEGVADGEVQAEAVLEAFDVVEAGLGRLVGRMQGNAHIEAQHEELHVVAQAEACAYGQVGKGAGRELGAGTLGVSTQGPHVAGIEEYSSVKVAHEPRAQFDVGF